LTFALNQTQVTQFGSGTLGTVVLTQIAPTTVDVTVTAAPMLFINSGGPHTPFTFNTALTGLSVSFIQPLGGTYSKGAFSLSLGTGSNPGYGTFSNAIIDSAGNGKVDGYPGTLEFTVTLSSGISTTDFTGNAGGYFFSADLSDLSGNTGAVATFGAVVSGGGNTNPAPEPTTLMLLGSGLIGLGAMRRWKNVA
jgi:hypothetical protein